MAPLQIFLRQVGDQVLTLVLDDSASALRDIETGSQWSIATGLATAGPLQGQALRPVPYISSFDGAWLDFHPDSKIYR